MAIDPKSNRALVQFCVDFVKRKRETHKAERWGQAFFNTLQDVRPDLAQRLRDEDLDPFYIPDAENGGRDSIEEHINFVCEHWEE